MALFSIFGELLNLSNMTKIEIMFVMFVVIIGVIKQGNIDHLFVLSKY